MKLGVRLTEELMPRRAGAVPSTLSKETSEPPRDGGREPRDGGLLDGLLLEPVHEREIMQVIVI